MRYEVGQTVPFIKVEFDNNGVFSMLSAYLPWSHTLTKINIEVMQCIEHHKVPTTYGDADDKKADGFIFSTFGGSIWHNQYPLAAYGQIDDSADRRINVKDNRFDYMQDGMHYLANVERGIEMIKEDSPENAKLLEKHRDEVIALIEKATAKKVVIKPAVISLNDGGEVPCPGFFDAFLVERELVAA